MLGGQRYSGLADVAAISPVSLELGRTDHSGVVTSGQSEEEDRQSADPPLFSTCGAGGMETFQRKGAKGQKRKGKKEWHAKPRSARRGELEHGDTVAQRWTR